MNHNDQFKSAYFDVLLHDFTEKILGRAHGNYTKSYESFKRINNTETCFREAIKDNPKQKVLDVGCGDGYHLCVFNSTDDIRRNVRFYGIEKSELRVEFASRACNELSFTNIDFLVGSADDLPFPDNYFDIILCSDVIEHLLHPEKCFSEMNRVLKRGGVVIVTTPNKTTFPQQAVNIFRKSPRKEQCDDDDHISLKGVNEWMEIARAAGFDILKVRRGALIFGGPRYNQYPALFSFVLMLDRLIDFVPFSTNWAEAITLNLKKHK